jgi:regulator of sigma E protease
MQLFEIVWLPVFLIMISVLVAAHEYGHYLFARIFKMGIEEFAIGFGKRPLWIMGRKKVGIKLTDEELRQYHWREAHGTENQEKTLPFEGRGGIAPREELVDDTLYQETAFTIRPWPIGGFVRIKGMIPEEDGSEVNIPGGFYSKPPWQRFIVLFAGPVFSVLAGVILLVGLFTTAGVDRHRNTPVIGPLSVEGAAAKAGLKEGDLVLTVNGRTMATYFDIIRQVRESGGRPLEFRYERNGKVATATVQPYLDPKLTPVFDENLEPTAEARSQYKLGVGFITDRVRIGFAEAVVEAGSVPIKAVQGIVGMFTQPSTFSQNVGGPATMLMVTRESVKEGVYRVFSLAAILSISVGILNLLPVPPLDGGQMMMAVIEMLRGGRRLSIQIQGTVAAIGLALVATLMLSVFFVDYKRWFTPSETKSSSRAAPANQSNPPPKPAR